VDFGFRLLGAALQGQLVPAGARPSERD